MAEPIIRLRGLSKNFSGVHAVQDLELDVLRGARHAVLGPNGAGKTTLFNLISGAEEVSSGTIELFGRDVTHLSAFRRARLGMARTFQSSRVLSGLNVEDNLYLAALGSHGGHLRILPSRSDRALRQLARETAERVALSGRLDSMASDLSHGERRQLEVGLAIASQPQLMLLDEPAAGLARAERQVLMDILLGFDRSVTLVLIEHDMEVALTVAERVSIMHHGRIVVEGTTAEIRSDQRVQDIYLGRENAA